jgi:penicillin-binding protein 1B
VVKKKTGLVGTLTRVLRLRDGRLVKLFVALGLLLLAAAAWSIWPYWELAGRFESVPTVEPSRLYGQAFRLAPGVPLSAAELAGRLNELAYHPAGEGGLLPGTFRVSGDRVTLSRRHFRTGHGEEGGGLLVVELDGGRVSRLLLGERPVAEALLDPPLLATFYGPELLERRPVRLADIPPDAVRAVLAAEDAAFFEHPGISLGGMLRAFWTNLRAGEVRQGGSTITQQLAKNLYLSNERRVSRKVREALLAVMLEIRYSKEQILEAYLNQIYWGRSGSANLIGIGAAAWAWLGKPASELDLADGALLAGMIPAPSDLGPTKHPEVARERRDRVLERLVELRWMTRASVDAAKARPIAARDVALSRKLAPYYADAAVAEVKRRWGVSEIADAGLTIYGTLDPLDQRAAEAAVAAGVGELVERSAKVRRKEANFQAALVAIEPASGAVRAYVGGRDYRESQFDRAGQAKRQAGSAFKPIVYATAFEKGTATPATLLEDAPFTIMSGGEEWSPSNDDDQYRGWVTVRTALEKSLNVPTARLALQTGLDDIVNEARAFGISARLRPFPSVALGAFEVTPLELAGAYATLANRGVRPPVHLVEAVRGADGKALEGQLLPEARAVLSPQSAYLVTALLQGVVDYGTGASVRTLGLRDPVAGKTGTTNRRRDNWFAGFAPERLALVWVGFDDDTPTPFSGSKAALPIWTKFMLATRPPGGYTRYQPPTGVQVVLIDPQTGELATDRCPDVLAEAFRSDRIPSSVCHLHGGWRAQAIDPGIRAERDSKKGSLREWLRKIFGRDRDKSGKGPTESPTGPPP